MKKRIEHGQGRTRLYGIWCDMKRRCYNKDREGYNRYGGRGIKVCSEWLTDFPTFMLWAMSNGYTDDLQIDRIDNDKGYHSSNCRWTTTEVNCRNRRCTKLNWEIVNEIRRLRNQTNLTQEEISMRFNISNSHVGNILNNRKWRIGSERQK